MLTTQLSGTRPAPTPAAASPSTTESCRGLLRAVQPSERRCTFLFFCYAFLLLICYYILKTLREPLLLAGGSAQLKSYAYAAIALVLIVLVPLYGALFRRTANVRLVQWITLFFAVAFVLFYWFGRAGRDIGFAYYVCVGVFGVGMLAQFWAHAAHSFDVASGERLFPAVMVGATLGALAGPALAGALFAHVGPWNLLLLAVALLAATVPLVPATRNAIPAASRNRRPSPSAPSGHLLSGLALVARDRYLLLLALLTVLLNCVNTIGDYVLTELVIRYADARLAIDPAANKSTIIAAFYADYYLTVNALTVVVQVLLVGRLLRRIGVRGAVLALPVIALLGYGLIAFLPTFGVIWAVKVVENGVNYSLINTARQMLYLPLSAAQQFEGKTAIDAVFTRGGDLLQAAVIFVGASWLGFEVQQFALLNLLLAAVWIAIAVRVGRNYSALAAHATVGVAQRRPIARGSLAAVGLAALTVSAQAAAEPSALFAASEPLRIELNANFADLCRDPSSGCADTPAVLVHRAADGSEQHLQIALRSRGRWRKDTANCRLPALFVSFADTPSDSPFVGQRLLPLTTHCRQGARYDQYVLSEYLAYRIYNALSDKSLRVRLAEITYRDPAAPDRPEQHYGFFTEHFESLAARHAADVVRPHDVDLERVVWPELATLSLFEYLIGNTDWSAIYGHNVVHLRGTDGEVTMVPYDFDYSGLVDAEYAAPSPKLPIRDVKQRLFRGFCRTGTDWEALFLGFLARRAEIERLPTEIAGLDPRQRERARAYLGASFAILESPDERAVQIVAACRAGGPVAEARAIVSRRRARATALTGP